MRVLSWFAFLGTGVAALPQIGQPIEGGSATLVESYPFMSCMQRSWLGVWWRQGCGGALLSATSVLSAAHCYTGDLSSRWRVRLGSSVAGSGGAEHEVSQLVLHPQYDGSTLDSDIAIVRLARAAVFEVSVGVASVAGPDYSLADGTKVIAIGWGTLTPGSESPKQLQHVVIAVISHAYCEERYAWLKTQVGFENWPDVTDNMVCTGPRHGRGEACPGTAGDPLVHHGNVLVGITSWGNGCASLDFPSVSACVSKYTDWITSTA